MQQQLRSRDILTSRQLADALLGQKRVLALPGSAFGAPPELLALRLSVCDYLGAEALAASAECEIDSTGLLTLRSGLLRRLMLLRRLPSTRLLRDSGHMDVVSGVVPARAFRII